MVTRSSHSLSYLVSILIRFLRPFFGPARCKFAIGCTQFAITQLKIHRFLHAFLLICKRLLLCSPLGSLYNWYRSRSTRTLRQAQGERVFHIFFMLVILLVLVCLLKNIQRQTVKVTPPFQQKNFLIRSPPVRHSLGDG